MPPSNDEVSAGTERGETSPPLVTPFIEERIRATVRTHLRQPVEGPEWRDTLRPLCLRARQQQVPPEQLLVELKRVLTDSCASAGWHQGATRSQLITRLVTISIEEYFSGDSVRSEC